ncbi:MAG: hypothetical protein IKX88_03665, partial [Thermoguttaceae bacterium]|nr:hypothetical protein [Thermoguttaceae bacterium]
MRRPLNALILNSKEEWIMRSDKNQIESSEKPFYLNLSSEAQGFCCAVLSAICYTVSLGSLRGITEYNVSPYW